MRGKSEVHKDGNKIHVGTAEISGRVGPSLINWGCEAQDGSLAICSDRDWGPQENRAKCDDGRTAYAIDSGKSHPKKTVLMSRRQVHRSPLVGLSSTDDLQVCCPASKTLGLGIRRHGYMTSWGGRQRPWNGRNCKHVEPSTTQNTPQKDNFSPFFFCFKKKNSKAFTSVDVREVNRAS
ncbi:hypothetical protein TWF594_011582 [Orbilia oligospora]|nr:hypothetical protein TWF594_011582 [Orbilia oligospora]